MSAPGKAAHAAVAAMLRGDTQRAREITAALVADAVADAERHVARAVTR